MKKCFAEVLWRSGVEKIAGKCCREVLWGSVVEK